MRPSPTSQATAFRQSVLGESESIRKVFQLIQRVAGTDATVLIVGENGTGKDKAALEKALEPYRQRQGIEIAEGETSLEDVFIQFMAGSKDNMA